MNMSDLIIAAIVTIAIVIILSTWRIGRQVVLTSLRHPLSTSIIHISETPNKKNGRVEVTTSQEPKHRREEERHVDHGVAVG